jgi:hypothetical protein
MTVTTMKMVSVMPNTRARFSTVDSSAMKALKLGPTSERVMEEHASDAAHSDAAQATQRIRDPTTQDLQSQGDDLG